MGDFLSCAVGTRPGLCSFSATKFRHSWELNGATKAALNSPPNELRTQRRSRRSKAGAYPNPQLVAPINDLYREEWSAYQNFFCPSMKLVSKVRRRSRYVKHYDPPQTPYEHLLQSPVVTAENKHRLQAAYARLNPFVLKKIIEQKLKSILRSQVSCFPSP